MLSSTYLILILLLAFVAGIRIQPRIVGGGKASVRKYPYQVSIRNAGKHICGGVIIKQATILTAGHCVQNRNPSALSIRAGSDYRETGGTVVRVRGYRIHPKFDRTWLNYDLAVVYLKTPLPINSKVNAIPLNTNRLRSQTAAVATGWGTTKENGPLSNVLKSTSLRTVSQTKCRQVYGKAYRRSMFCAGSKIVGSDTCQGDSGGPLVSNGKLVGITSHGNGCGKKGWPGIYTTVRYLRRWINKVA